MSIQDETSRIIQARNTIRNKMIAVEQATVNDLIDDLAENLDLSTSGYNIVITTSDERLYGETVTIKQGSTVIGTTAFDNTGRAEYSVSSVGTYTVSITYQGKETTKEVVIEDIVVDIEASLSLSTWISAGSTTEYPLDPEDYPTFADLEADEEAIRQLMLVHNAVDYLATAGADDALIEDVINSDICAKWINLSDYALDTLSANTDIKSVMDEADKYGYGEWVCSKALVPTMTGATAPSGEAFASSEYSSTYAAWKAFDGNTNNYWVAQNGSVTNQYIGYDFGVETRVVGVKIASLDGYNKTVQHFKVQYSNTSKTEGYLDATDILINPMETTTGSFTMHFFNVRPASGRYWRVLAIDNWGHASELAVPELQFLAYEPLGNVPIMTANNAPYGECVGTAGQSSSYDLCKAFDGDTTTIWNTAAGLTTATIGYHFPNPVNVRKIQYMAFNASSPSQYGNSHNLTLEYSNDGTNYTAISGATFNVAANQCKTELEFTSDNNIYAPYWIIRFSDSNYVNGGNRYILTASLQFYGREMSDIIGNIHSADDTKIANIVSNGDNIDTNGWKAFDGDWTSSPSYSSKWYSWPLKNPDYLGYDFGEPVHIGLVKFRPGWQPSYSWSGVVNYKIQYSDDNETWSDATGTKTDGGSNTIHNVPIDSSVGPHRYWRFSVLSTSSPSGMPACLYNLAFIGTENYSEKEFAPGSTRKTIYDHGVKPSGSITASSIGTSSNSMTEESNQLLFSISGSSAQAVVLSPSVDMSDYDNLWVKVGNKATSSSVNFGHLRLLANASNFTGQKGQYTFPNPLTDLNPSLDVSQINEGVYIAPCTDNAGSSVSHTLTMKELYLE